MRISATSDVICCCGHRSVSSLRARCPSCGASHHDRVTPVRMRVLEALDRASPQDPPLYVEPVLRIWLATHGLIAATEPPIAPSDEKRTRRPVRRHVPTDKGRAVLAAAAATGRAPCICCGQPTLQTSLSRVRDRCQACRDAGCVSSGGGDTHRADGCPLLLAESAVGSGVCMCMQCGDPLHRSEPINFVDNSNPGLGGCHARCVSAYHSARGMG